MGPSRYFLCQATGGTRKVNWERAFPAGFIARGRAGEGGSGRQVQENGGIISRGWRVPEVKVLRGGATGGGATGARSTRGPRRLASGVPITPFHIPLAGKLHLNTGGWFMRKSLLVLLCAGLLSEIALPPLVAQSSKTSSTRRARRSRRGRRARNVGIGAAGGAAGGAILGGGRGAGAGAVIGGAAGALTPTRRRR